MKKFVKSLTAIVLGTTLVAGVTACGGSGYKPDTTPTTVITKLSENIKQLPTQTMNISFGSANNEAEVSAYFNAQPSFAAPAAVTKIQVGNEYVRLYREGAENDFYLNRITGQSLSKSYEDKYDIMAGYAVNDVLDTVSSKLAEAAESMGTSSESGLITYKNGQYIVKASHDFAPTINGVIDFIVNNYDGTVGEALDSLLELSGMTDENGDPVTSIQIVDEYAALLKTYKDYTTNKAITAINAMLNGATVEQLYESAGMANEYDELVRDYGEKTVGEALFFLATGAAPDGVPTQEEYEVLVDSLVQTIKNNILKANVSDIVSGMDGGVEFLTLAAIIKNSGLSFNKLGGAFEVNLDNDYNITRVKLTADIDIKGIDKLIGNTSQQLSELFPFNGTLFEITMTDFGTTTVELPANIEYGSFVGEAYAVTSTAFTRDYNFGIFEGGKVTINDTSLQSQNLVKVDANGVVTVTQKYIDSIKQKDNTGAIGMTLEKDDISCDFTLYVFGGDFVDFLSAYMKSAM